MSRQNNLITIFLCSVFLTSCGSSPDVPLEIPIADSDTYFVDGAAKSCRILYEGSSAGDEYDIQSHYFQVQNLKLIWTESTTKFNLSSVRLVIASPYIENSPVTILLSSSEIAYLTGSAATPWNQRMDSSAIVSLNCPLTFGGLTILKKIPFSTKATIEFIGYKFKVDSNNEIYDEEPVTLTKVVSIKNL